LAAMRRVAGAFSGVMVNPGGPKKTDAGGVQGNDRRGLRLLWNGKTGRDDPPIAPRRHTPRGVVRHYGASGAQILQALGT